MSDSRHASLAALATLFWRSADRRSRLGMARLIALSTVVAFLELALLAGIFGFFHILVHPGEPIPLFHTRLDEAALPVIAAGLFGVSLLRAVLQYRLIVSRNAMMAQWVTALLRRLFAIQLDMPWSRAGARDLARSATSMSDRPDRL
jgi:hypothetical protein